MGKTPQGFSVTLSNGRTILYSSQLQNNFLGNFIDAFLIPLYLDTNDWDSTLRTSISEIDRVCHLYHLPQGKMINDLLDAIELHLPKEISELPHVDKIEILFGNIEDYVDKIKTIVKEKKDQEQIRLEVAEILEHLNVLEISELLLFFMKQ